jgi:hypothetical protein
MNRSMQSLWHAVHALSDSCAIDEASGGPCGSFCIVFVICVAIELIVDPFSMMASQFTYCGHKHGSFLAVILFHVRADRYSRELCILKSKRLYTAFRPASKHFASFGLSVIATVMSQLPYKSTNCSSPGYNYTKLHMRARNSTVNYSSRLV